MVTTANKKQVPVIRKKTLQPTISFTGKEIRKIKCKECSMDYRPSVPDDVKLHTKYHQSKLTISLNNPVISNRLEKFKIYDIFSISSESEIITKVNNLLGGTELERNKLVTLVACVGKIVHACVILEPVKIAYKIVDNGDYESLQCDKSAQYDVVAGISRIWVSDKSRRQGLAMKLLNVARSVFTFGTELENSELAFSQPTPAGHQLATKYFGRNDYLVYL